MFVSWFYLWTIVPDGVYEPFRRGDNGYYNLLMRGFCKGQLSLDRTADPFLATMHNPYDAVERGDHGLHDVTYFKGKYYLYFGVTPVLVLFAPVRLLTGWCIGDEYAVWLFSLMGFWVLAAIVRDVRRRWFAEFPDWLAVLTIPVLGFATLVPALLRRASVWEVPISCAYAFFMVALFSVLRAMTGPRKTAWLVAASVAMGLCIGARPTYLAAAVVLLLPLAPKAGGWRPGDWRAAALSIFVPIALIGAGLAAYNFFRFGRVSEFGWTYMMAGENNSSGQMFSLAAVMYNLRIYLFSAAGVSPFFPFVTVIVPPPLPAGHMGIENPYGLLSNEPWIWFAAGAVWTVAARRLPRPIRWFCGGLLFAGVATLFLVASFRFAADRYEVDFTAVWVLLGSIGIMALLARTRGVLRWMIASIALVFAGWSVAFGMLVSVQHNELLRVNHPAVYARLVHAFNRPAQLVDRALGADYGPVELKVIFPAGAVGQIEPLVSTGRTFRADYLYVHYLDETTVRFGFEHTSHGGAVGPPMKIVPGVAHTVRVDMGSLYPPAGHPWFDRLSGPEKRARERCLRVELDGRVALERMTTFYDATERVPAIGTTGDRPGFKRNFSGQLLNWRRLSGEELSLPNVEKTGVLRLRLHFPRFGGRHAEPLLSSGEQGKGDLVFVTYEDASHVTFGHDHWSVGGSQSEKIEIDPAAEHVLEIACPPLLGPDTPPRLRILLDGREVFAVAEEFYPCDPDTVVMGANEIHASSAQERFTGEIMEARRVPP